MEIQVYAPTGKSIPSGRAFIFTGNGGSGFWEVDLPTAGDRIHGISITQIDEFNNYDAFVAGAGPSIVQLSTNVTKGDDLGVDSNGKFRVKLSSDALAGVALADGNSGSNTVAFITAQK